MRTAFLAAPLFAALSVAACADLGDPPLGDNRSSTGTLDPLEDPSFAPAPGGVRRLLARQYRNSIELVLGESAAIAADPPEDPTLNELEPLAAAELAPPPSAVDQYERSARAVALATIDDAVAMSRIVTCVPSSPDDAACHREVIETVGHHLWRRPLAPEESAPIVAIAQAAATEYSDFDLGVAYGLSTLLQSPYFLYAVELGVPDAEHGGKLKLTGPELATRLSLFLIDAIPDAALLDAAEAGGLETPEQIEAAARDLLARPEARGALASFYDVFFKLRDLPTTTKLPDVFPEWSPALASSMRRESLIFFEDIVWNQNGDYRDIFTANYTFADATLAAFYGLKPGAVKPDQGFVRVTLPDEQLRTGFLGHASHLARYAHSGETSPTRRGVFLSTALLCQDIPPPPAGVNTKFPAFDPDKPMTKKQYLEEVHHNVSASCASCHELMDPLGYAMESYDGIGKFRTKDENGLPIDPTGELDGLGAFTDARSLGQLLRDDPRTMECIVSHLLRQSMGHKPIDGERPALAAIQTAFRASGYRLQEALVEIVKSPAFTYVGDPK